VALAAVTAAVLALTVAPPAQAAKKPKIVYLTFDDGPNAGNDPRLLRLLAREQVPATFFLVGQSLAADPAQATRLWLAGHAVGNHTWSHANLTQLDPAGIHHQIASMQRLLGAAGGKCLRPPYGATSPTVSAVARGLGLKQVMWTVDPQDWAHQDAAYIATHVLTHVRDKSIVLLHDGGGPRLATISAVKRIIPELRQRGYEFRTIPSCRVPFTGWLFDAAKPKPRPKPTKPDPQPSPTSPQAGGMGS